MLGSLKKPSRNLPNPKSLVIGGGISGLLASYRLLRAGHTVTLREASDRLGGLIQTRHTPYGPSESAAHSLLVSNAVKRLIDDLKVSLNPVNSNAKARYIYRNGKLKKIPLTIPEILQTLWRAALVKPLPSQSPSFSVSEWANHHLGKAATDYLIGPAVLGIYATDPNELDLKLAFPKLELPLNTSLLKHWFKTKKGGALPLHSFNGGTEELISALTHFIKSHPQATLLLESPLTQDELTTIENQSLYDNVIITTPAEVAAHLFEKVDSSLSLALKQIRYAPIVSLTAFYPKNELTDFKKYPGIGVLFPRSENIRTLGILFNSSAFPDKTISNAVESFSFLFGGTTDPEVLTASPEELTQLAKTTLQTLFHTTDDLHLLHYEVYRWKNAIPLYNHTLSQFWETAKKSWCTQPGHLFFSNYSKQVSLRGLIEDSENLE